MTHRITFVSNLDAKPQTRKFKTYAQAQEAWTGMLNSMVRYALWVELTDSGEAWREIHGEVHASYYLNTRR